MAAGALGFWVMRGEVVCSSHPCLRAGLRELASWASVHVRASDRPTSHSSGLRSQQLGDLWPDTLVVTSRGKCRALVEGQYEPR